DGVRMKLRQDFFRGRVLQLGGLKNRESGLFGRNLDRRRLSFVRAAAWLIGVRDHQVDRETCREKSFESGDRELRGAAENDAHRSGVSCQLSVVSCQLFVIVVMQTTNQESQTTD